MYKPVWLDAQGRAVRLGAQGKAEQQLGGAEQRLGRAEQRLGRAEAWWSRRGDRALWSGRAFGCSPYIEA